MSVNDNAWPGNALAAVLEARERACAAGRREGARWLIECRDLWDFAKMDEDAGIFFIHANTAEEVDTLVAKYAADRYNCIDGIFDLDLPLDEYHDIAPEDWLSGIRTPRRRNSDKHGK